ncbi:MAG TPA: AraC family transcriptional regulator [Polyangiales bacterium]
MSLDLLALTWLAAAMAIGPLYRCILEVARERGVDVEAVLRESGLTAATLVAPGTRLSPEVGRALGGALIHAIKLPSVGLAAARHFRLGDFDLLGYVMKFSPTVGEMLTAASQYGRLLGDTADFRVELSPGQVAITVGRSGGRKYLHEAADFAAAAMALSIRELAGAEIDPSEVRLPREQPHDERPYQRLFRCRIVFGAEHASLVYPASILTLPGRHADPQLVEILRRQADDAVAKVPAAAPLALRVRAQLAAGLDRGCPDLAAIAQTLAMSERTLRRHLREAGTGFRELLDDVRRERALLLADEGGRSATEIAVMVGFEDTAAFARAFKRWTGALPRDYLARARRDPRASRESHVDAPALRLVKSGR